MAKASTAVAKKADPSDNTPAFMKDDMGKGRPNIDRSDLEIPRLKLMQGTSKELESYNDLRPGMFFHTSTEDIFKGALKVVPIFFEKKFLLWNPLDSGGGILARADDGVHWSPANQSFDVKLDRKYGGKNVKWKTASTVLASGLDQWGTMDPEDPNSQPAATLMYNYLFGFPDYPEVLPAVYTFQRAAAKAGKKFNTKLAINRTPMFGLIFELTATKATNKADQSYYVPTLTGAGKVQDEALYNEYKEMNAGYSEAGMKIDEEALHRDEQETSEGREEAEEPASAGGKSKRKY